MIYIYLNIYPNGFMYVGSHKWSGDGLDPNYYGSSHVAARYGWKPCNIRILQEVDEVKSVLNSEHYWIERFAARYGVADCARRVGGSKVYRWASRFKIGRMLNLHSNDASYATEAARSLEARAKMTENRTRSGVREKSVKAMLAAITTESRLLAASHKDYSEISKKVANTKRGISGTYRVCSVVLDGITYEGSVQTVCRAIGHENWNCHISRKFKEGLVSVNHHDLVFNLKTTNVKKLQV